jgi:predicted dienelactone hydrolase
MLTSARSVVERSWKARWIAAVSSAVAVLGATAIVTAGPVAAAPQGTTPAGQTDRLVLPAPTGPYPVGQEDLYLVDHDRTDPWVPTGPRELMVSMWYPAAAARGPHVPYASAEEARLLLDAHQLTDVPADKVARIGTHARAGAPPLRTPGGLPLIVLSPGLAHPSFMLTSLAEDLASRGYVVAGIDHTHEAVAVTFPDGRMAAGCIACNVANGSQIVASRVQDVKFVLDRVLGHQRYGRLIDPHRIAMVGHSMGGSSASRTMLADPRVDAGINLDGEAGAPIDRDLGRPFLVVGAGPEGVVPGGYPGSDQTWSHLTGWRRWLHIPELDHLSLCDAAVIGPWVGVPLQPIPGERVVEIVRTYVAAFADEHLRHRHQPLLDGPSPRFPEVDFVGPAAE